MKKLAIMAMIMMVGGASFASTLFWGTQWAISGNFTGAPDIYKADGNALVEGDGYFMYLFENDAPSVSELNNLGSTALTDTPVRTANGATAYTGEDGVFYNAGFVTPTELSSSTVYTSLLISHDATSTIAGEYSYVLFDSFTATQGSIAPEPFFNYDLGTVSQGDWTAIPEPSTMLLGGIGLLGLWIRRRMSK
jgi:hypothetical protein